MINSFRALGKGILQGVGYYETDDVNEKRKIFLNTQSIVLPVPNFLHLVGNFQIDWKESERILRDIVKITDEFKSVIV